jgi:hypothetical protein
MNQAIEAVEQVIIGGDLADLNQGERLKYVTALCKSMGLNPLTKPFEFLNLQGRTVLYARKDCADQLRKIHGVSIRVIDKEEIDGLYIVTVQAQDRNGRADEDMGAVAIAGLRGEIKANAIAKAITKAKRRVTLSICGLGIIDETEADDIPHASPVIWQPDSPSKAIEGPSGAEEPRGATKMPEEAAATPPPAKADTGGFVLSFLETEDGEQEAPIVFDEDKEWIKEYILQMASILNNQALKPRDRMTALKNFETTNKAVLDLLPKDTVKNLYERRIKANKKLGPLK